MKNFITTYTGRDWMLNSFGNNAVTRSLLFSFFAFVIFLTILPNTGSLYAQCSGSTPSVLSKWDFNTAALQCNGAVMKGGDWSVTSPRLSQNKYTYCPNINSGCGQALLGSKGYSNTPDFKGALCLSGYWRQGSNQYAVADGWKPGDLVFKPEIGGNIYVTQTFPSGKAGSITSFALKVIQKQYDGSTIPYEKQGMAVFRNGVKIYEESKAITASNINGTAITFTFPSTPDFISDGSAEVKFEIVFGLVHRLNQKPVAYDDICINGTCGGGSPIPFAAIKPATCGTGSANSDGTITLSNFGVSDKYDFNVGSTYTGAKTYANATAIPVGGVITNSLPNPVANTVYTVRVFTSSGCTTDLQVTLVPTSCSAGSCATPTATVTPTPATCTGSSSNSNASIAITGVTNGTKVGISLGEFYSGPGFAAAQTLTGGSYTFSGLPNANGLAAYTVRVFNADDLCFKDYLVTIAETPCACKKIVVQVKKSDQADPDSNPNNNLTEDDLTTYEVCAGTDYIDLKLAKTVNPQSGTTCPTNTPFVWTLTLTNEGTMTATNIQVADNMPAGLVEIVSSASVGTYNPVSGWLVPSLAAGASATLTITTQATQAGTYQNCAWVNGAFPLNDIDSSPLNDGAAAEDDDDCATITVTGAKTPEITKEFSPYTVKTGVPVKLTIKIINNESTPINMTAALVDVLPSSPAQMVIAPTPNLTTGLTGVIATAGGTSITIPNGTVLLPGLNQIQVDVIAPVNGNYCNKILSGALKTTSCDNVAETEACLEAQSTYVMAPLIKKSFSPEIVQTGQNSTLTITIENRNATGITLLQDFIDDLPSGVVLAGTASGTCPGISTFSSTNQVGLITGSVLAPGTCTITVPVKGSSAGTYCNRILQNSMIGNVSNGTIPVMTGNDDIAEACLKIDPNPCTTIDITGLTPAAPKVVPNGTVSLTANGTGLGASTLYTWSGTGTFNPHAVTTTYTAPSTAGTYTIKVVANNGLTGYGTCKDSISVQITVEDICAGIKAGPDQLLVCSGTTLITTATLAATPITGGVWSQAAGNPAGANITDTGSASSGITGLVAGVYKFIWTSPDACKDTVRITVPNCACPKPTLTINSAPTCSSDKQTYSVTFSVTGKNGILKANGVALIGNSPYVITIPSGTNLTITDSLSALCKHDTTILAPSCGCPVSAPVAVAPSVVACQGEGIPMLSVTVPTGVTANWYASQTSTSALVSNSLTYTPTAAGTYWVEAVVIGPQGCVSTIRTPITLSVISTSCVPVTLRKMKN